MVAVPAATPVTRPVVLTVAMLEALVAHVTASLVALEGATVAVSCCVPPTRSVAVVGETETPVTATVVEVTVMVEVELKLPSAVTALMVALPTATPVTSPDVLTVATEEELVDHVTAWFVALLGEMLAVSCFVSPTGTLAEVGMMDTPVTETVEPPVGFVTTTVEVAVGLEQPRTQSNESTSDIVLIPEHLAQVI